MIVDTMQDGIVPDGEDMKTIESRINKWLGILTGITVTCAIIVHFMANYDKLREIVKGIIK